jgi:hexosaminidase
MNINVIPKPYLIEEKANNFSFKKALNVKGCKDSKSLNNLIKFLNSLDIKTDDKESKIIELIIDKKIISTEEYLLDVDENTIKISASTDLGLYYGVQTLKQLIFDNLKNDEVIIPCIKINDKPLYSYRGYMLDIVRHFFGKEEIKRLIDLISLLKINVFHLHMTDDQGWRIEISKYPNLIS